MILIIGRTHSGRELAEHHFADQAVDILNPLDSVTFFRQPLPNPKLEKSDFPFTGEPDLSAREYNHPIKYVWFPANPDDKTDSWTGLEQLLDNCCERYQRIICLVDHDMNGYANTLSVVNHFVGSFGLIEYIPNCGGTLPELTKGLAKLSVDSPDLRNSNFAKVYQEAYLAKQQFDWWFNTNSEHYLSPRASSCGLCVDFPFTKYELLMLNWINQHAPISEAHIVGAAHNWATIEKDNGESITVSLGSACSRIEIFLSLVKRGVIAYSDPDQKATSNVVMTDKGMQFITQVSEAVLRERLPEDFKVVETEAHNKYPSGDLSQVGEYYSKLIRLMFGSQQKLNRLQQASHYITAYQSIITLDADHIMIEANIGEFLTETEAREAARSVRAKLRVSADNAFIEIASADHVLQLLDTDISVFELPQSVIDRLGTPIDVGTERGRDKAVEALNNGDPAYCVSTEEYKPSALTLTELLNRFGNNYSFSISATRVKAITPEHPKSFKENQIEL